MMPTLYAESSPVRTTLNIDDGLFERASELTGVTEKTALVRQGLCALIEREASRRLAKLGGKDATAEAPARRRITRPR